MGLFDRFAVWFAVRTFSLGKFAQCAVFSAQNPLCFVSGTHRKMRTKCAYLTAYQTAYQPPAWFPFLCVDFSWQPLWQPITHLALLESLYGALLGSLVWCTHHSRYCVSRLLAGRLTGRSVTGHYTNSYSVHNRLISINTVETSIAWGCFKNCNQYCPIPWKPCRKPER